MSNTLKLNPRAFLIAFVAVLPGGCQLSGFGQGDPMADLREQIEITVADESRVEAMLRVVDAIESQLLEIAEAAARDLRAKDALFADYQSTRADFEALFARSIQEQRAMQGRLLALHVEFKSYLGDEEWDAILPVHTRAIASRASAAVIDAFERRRGG